MNKTYEDVLPEGYKEVKVIDALDKKTVIIMNISALLLMVICLLVNVFIYHPEIDDITLSDNLILIGLMFIYVVLHEIVHGIAYKIMTKKKLTFGFSGTVAYCGVKDIYVYRTTALIALMAPFLTFNIVYISLMFVIRSGVYYYILTLLLSMHVGGCVGDLYDTYLLLFKYKEDSILVFDDGPKQMIYRKES